MIKSIETKYRGFRFRSRLEARWAVFFTTLGVEWEYENKRYDLGYAGSYLPDFYFPDLYSFIEIKPYDKVPRMDMPKYYELARNTDRTVLVVHGNPYPQKYKIIIFGDYIPLRGSGYTFGDLQFALYRDANEPDALVVSQLAWKKGFKSEIFGRLMLWAPSFFDDEHAYFDCPLFETRHSDGEKRMDSMMEAYIHAMGYDFETEESFGTNFFEDVCSSDWK